MASCLDLVDPILRRPGRLHACVEVCLPGLKDRFTLLNEFAKNQGGVPRDVYDSFAKASEGCTASDIAAVLRTTVAEASFRCARKVRGA